MPVIFYQQQSPYLRSMKARRILLVGILFFNSISALYGGFVLLLDPSGGLMQMKTEWLKNSPFDDFLVPGILLFSVLGAGSLVTAVFILIRHRIAYWLGIAEGLGTLIWIITEVIMIRELSFLQLIYGITGGVIFTFSLLMIRQT